jgi:GAF domain-containing protein
VADQTLESMQGAGGVMIGLADAQGVSYVWSAGADAAATIGTRVNMDSSLSGLAVKNRRAVWAEDIPSDPRADQSVARQLSIASAICVPLIRGREVLGVMAVVAPEVRAFEQEDVDTLTKLAGFVSVTIALTRDLARMNEKLLGFHQN